MQQVEDTTQALSWSELEQLLQPDAAREARHAVVRKLLRGAAQGRREGAAPRETAPGNAPEPAVEAAYGTAIQKAVANARRRQERLMQERRNAGRLLEILESQPPARRRILAHNDRRFHTWGLYDCLVERYHAFLEKEPAVAAESAELALTVARGLSPTVYGEDQVHDFQAAALILLGQARRIARDLEGAQSALDQAAELLAMGSGDLLERAELESARAALLRDLGRPEEAEIAGRKAVRLARRVGGPRERAAQRSLDDTHSDLRRGGRFPISAFRPRLH
ncbi:MAG TPA: hypothetical protein VGH73_06145 [Thermoanaerobaculia bacterium]